MTPKRDKKGLESPLLAATAIAERSTPEPYQMLELLLQGNQTSARG